MDAVVEDKLTVLCEETAKVQASAAKAEANAPKAEENAAKAQANAAKARAESALALRLIAEMTGQPLSALPVGSGVATGQAAAAVLPLSQSRHSLVGSRPVDENAHREEKKEAPSSRAVSHG